MNFKLIIDIIIVLIIFSCFYVMGVLAQELYSDYKNKRKDKGENKMETKMESKKYCCCTDGHSMDRPADIMNKDKFLCGFGPSIVIDSNPVLFIDLEFVCGKCRAVIRTKEFINGQTKEIVKEMGYEIYRLKNLLNDIKNKEKRK